VLRGEKPALPTAREDFYPTLVDKPLGGVHHHVLMRMACKMATGSGKTVVMAMHISWVFCNRGQKVIDTRGNEVMRVHRLEGR